MQVGFPQVCLAQIRLPEHRFFEVYFDHLCPDQTTLVDLGALHNRLEQLGFEQIDPPEIGQKEIDVLQLGLLQIGLAQVRSSEQSSLQVGFAQVGPPQFRTFPFL